MTRRDESGRVDEIEVGTARDHVIKLDERGLAIAGVGQCRAATMPSEQLELLVDQRAIRCAAQDRVGIGQGLVVAPEGEQAVGAVETNLE